MWLGILVFSASANTAVNVHTNHQGKEPNRYGNNDAVEQLDQVDQGVIVQRWFIMACPTGGEVLGGIGMALLACF